MRWGDKNRHTCRSSYPVNVFVIICHLQNAFVIVSQHRECICCCLNCKQSVILEFIFSWGVRPQWQWQCCSSLCLWEFYFFKFYCESLAENQPLLAIKFFLRSCNWLPVLMMRKRACVYFHEVFGLASPHKNQHARQLISTLKMSHKHNNKDLSQLQWPSPGMRVNTMCINSN